MSDDSENTGPKPGRAKRVGSYFGRRVGNPFISRVGQETLSTGAGQARSVLKPERVTSQEVRGAIRGRYADGGRSRFQELMRENGLSAADLPRLEVMRTRQFRAMCLVSALALLIGAAVPFFTDDWLITISGLIFGLFSLVFLAVGVRHDFAAWQIRERRFGGLREYLDLRWGRG
jgi:hypothetical protein